MQCAKVIGMKHDAILYRNDIQGIRALAVLSVIAYHLPLSLVSGGFIGVDIFFVLSGYVITASSLKLLGGGDWRAVVTFYGKRARRLFPALVFTVILGLAAIAYLVPPDNSKPLFMAPKDPLHTKLDPDAETYFERHEPTEDTLERLSHIS